MNILGSIRPRAIVTGTLLGLLCYPFATGTAAVLGVVVGYNVNTSNGLKVASDVLQGGTYLLLALLYTLTGYATGRLAGRSEAWNAVIVALVLAAIGYVGDEKLSSGRALLFAGATISVGVLGGWVAQRKRHHESIAEK